MKLIMENWKTFLKEVDPKPMPVLRAPTSYKGRPTIKIDMTDLKTALDTLNAGAMDMKQSDNKNAPIMRQLALFVRDVIDEEENYQASETLPDQEMFARAARRAENLRRFREEFANADTLQEHSPLMEKLRTFFENIN